MRFTPSKITTFMAFASLLAAMQCTTRVPSKEAFKQDDEEQIAVPANHPPKDIAAADPKPEADRFLVTSEPAGSQPSPAQPSPAQRSQPKKNKGMAAPAAKSESEAQSSEKGAALYSVAPEAKSPVGTGALSKRMRSSQFLSGDMACRPVAPPMAREFNTENYAPIAENGFHLASHEPLSTFSVDVDNASYANIRRFLTQGQLPPGDAVRIEECINYFRYSYPEPQGEHPFSIALDMGVAPWNAGNKLVLIGLQAKHVDVRNLPPSNLVFLIDVSGSMDQANKLPLLKKSFRLLAEQLRPNDRVSIVVYAGSAGLVLPSTPGSHKQAIYDALDNLQAGGSTAGGEGLRLAYKIARENFLGDGNNRVILATDGDFNVGESSDGGMMRLIEEKRKSGVFLSVLGFGMGNIKDSKMEILADKGNGNYAYIDNLLEARKVLVEQMGGTLHTLAKDVKLQVEFNPARVSAYRLVGYENRLLHNEDFNDDTKDAGEMGAGHSVTALYEIVPVGADLRGGAERPNVDPLKYAPRAQVDEEGVRRFEDRRLEKHMVRDGDRPANTSEELLTVKFRYKRPTENSSRLLSKVLKDTPRSLEEATETLRFAAAVAGFGMLLRNSEHKGDLTFEKVSAMAGKARSFDPEGYRAEFIRLANLAGSLSKGTAQVSRDDD